MKYWGEHWSKDLWWHHTGGRMSLMRKKIDTLFLKFIIINNMLNIALCGMTVIQEHNSIGLLAHIQLSLFPNI